MIAGVVASTRRGFSSNWDLGYWVHFGYGDSTVLRTKEDVLIPLEGTSKIESFMISRPTSGSVIAYFNGTHTCLYDAWDFEIGEYTPFAKVPAEMPQSISLDRSFLYYTDHPFTSGNMLHVYDINTLSFVHSEPLPTGAHAFADNGYLYTVLPVEDSMGVTRNELVEYTWQDQNIRVLRKPEDDPVLPVHFIGVHSNYLWYRDDKNGYRLTRVNLMTLDREHLSLPYTDRYSFGVNTLFAHGPTEDYMNEHTHQINLQTMSRIVSITSSESFTSHTTCSLNGEVFTFKNAFWEDWTSSFYYAETSETEFPNSNTPKQLNKPEFSVYPWSMDVNVPMPV